ncbi:MAG TPA: hypothetical protein VNX21_08060 [Candidatus Thermoplasmatota archaeon]|nr:hypothetical protein [Candidatus Thermoplasmatota archaeon]
MATVVLLRGANLGKRRFSPKAVEAALADLGCASVGAAGTFVVRKRVAAAALRERVQAELPWPDAELVLLTEKEFRAALRAGEAVDVPAGAKRFATAMETKPVKPEVPLEFSEGRAWAVRVEAVEGRVALGVRRSVGATGVYPNEVVEKAYGVRATTRDWPTMEKVAARLDA